jgi:hypothetical protein
MSASKFSSPFMAKNPMSPLQGNAFIKAKMDAEQAGKESFVVDGKTYPVKGSNSPAEFNGISGKTAKAMADKVEQVKRYRSHVEARDKGYNDEETGEKIPASPERTVSFDRFAISEEIAKGGKSGSKAVKHYYANKDKYSGFLDEDKRQAVKKGLNIK